MFLFIQLQTLPVSVSIRILLPLWWTQTCHYERRVAASRRRAACKKNLKKKSSLQFKDNANWNNQDVLIKKWTQLEPVRKKFAGLVSCLTIRANSQSFEKTSWLCLITNKLLNVPPMMRMLLKLEWRCFLDSHPTGIRLDLTWVTYTGWIPSSLIIFCVFWESPAESLPSSISPRVLHPVTSCYSHDPVSLSANQISCT